MDAARRRLWIELILPLLVALLLTLMLISIVAAKTGSLDDSPIAGVNPAFWPCLFLSVALLTVHMVKSRRHALSLCLIAYLNLVLWALVQIKYASPWWLASDLFTHLGFVRDALLTGHVEMNYLYLYQSKWPLLDIGMVQVSLLTGLHPLDAARIIPIVVWIPSLLLTYLIFAIVCGDKNAGLLATLMFSLTDFVMLYVIQPVQQPFSLVFFFLLVYLLVRTLKSARVSYSILFVIATIALVTSHVMTPIILLGFLVGIFFKTRIDSGQGSPLATGELGHSG